MIVKSMKVMTNNSERITSFRSRNTSLQTSSQKRLKKQNKKNNKNNNNKNPHSRTEHDTFTIAFVNQANIDIYAFTGLDTNVCKLALFSKTFGNHSLKF